MFGLSPVVCLLLVVAAFYLMYLTTQTDPEEEARYRQYQSRHPIAQRVGKELGRTLIKHAKWAPPTHKKTVRRRRK